MSTGTPTTTTSSTQQPEQPTVPVTFDKSVGGVWDEATAPTSAAPETAFERAIDVSDHPAVENAWPEVDVHCDPWSRTVLLTVWNDRQREPLLVAVDAIGDLDRRKQIAVKSGLRGTLARRLAEQYGDDPEDVSSTAGRVDFSTAREAR